ncbi:MAG: Holliday junction resolvase RuvX [Actinobacteria bacterium]|nr:Holliday junction resolvase RuvX [Actinomycetota bacterium]
MRILGLDVGDARIGVAVTDPLGKIAQPLETIKRDGAEFQRLAWLASSYDLRLIVLGLPLLMSGSEGAQAAAVRDFAGELHDRLGIEITFVDERLTTKQADAVIRSAEKKSGSRGDSDRVAAALILSAYLNQNPQKGLLKE